MGLAKHANYSTIVGSVFYLVVMVILFATNQVSMVTLGLLTSATEVLIFLYRLVVVWHYRDRMRPDNRGRGGGNMSIAARLASAALWAEGRMLPVQGNKNCSLQFLRQGLR